MIVAARTEHDTGQPVLSGYAFPDSCCSAFAFDAPTGGNEAIARSDENGNAEIDAGDDLGVFCTLVHVIAGDVTCGVDITIDEIIRPSTSPRAVRQAAAQERWLGALNELARTRANGRGLTVESAVVGATSSPTGAGAAWGPIGRSSRPKPTPTRP